MTEKIFNCAVKLDTGPGTAMKNNINEKADEVPKLTGFISTNSDNISETSHASTVGASHLECVLCEWWKSTDRKHPPRDSPISDSHASSLKPYLIASDHTILINTVYFIPGYTDTPGGSGGHYILG